MMIYSAEALLVPSLFLIVFGKMFIYARPTVKQQCWCRFKQDVRVIANPFKQGP